mgnify:CR=1 FL=1
MPKDHSSSASSSATSDSGAASGGSASSATRDAGAAHAASAASDTRAASDAQALSDVASRGPERSSLSAAGRDRMRGADASAAPLDTHDPALMTLDSARFRPETRAALDAQGLDSAAIAADRGGDKAEAATRTILEREGIPDGAGGMEQVKRVVPGTHDGKHGIDDIAVTTDGKPIPLEVKNRADAANAALADHDSTALEPEVRKAHDAYADQVIRYRDEMARVAPAGDGPGDGEPLSAYDRQRRIAQAEGLAALRPDYADTWKPEVAQWHARMEADAQRLKTDKDGNVTLPVEQMDRFWTQDRYLKLLRSDGGPDRLRSAGVASEYCTESNFVDGNGNLRDTPLWDDVLANRTTVIVSPGDAPAGKRMLDQAIFEDRSHRVAKISL